MTQDELKTLLEYNALTGVFLWKVSFKNGIKAGDPAGYVNTYGYHSTRIRGVKYQTHRLVWLYVYGSFPTHVIDHINGNKTDNRIENLRDVTDRENAANKERHRKGKYVGVSVKNHSKKWVAEIRVKGKLHYLGSYLTEESAYEAYLQAVSNLNGAL